MKRGVKESVKNLFVGDIEIPDRFTPGIFKSHDYSSYRIAPSTDNDNSNLDTLVKAFHSIRNTQMMKSLRGGQPVVALELYADEKKSYYQYTVPSRNKILMKDKIHSAFKGGGIKEMEHTGWPFVDDHKDTLLAHLSLTKDPYFPILMNDFMLCSELLQVTDDVKKGEKCFVQILLEPADDGWQEDLERSYERYLQGHSSESAGGFLKAGGRSLDKKISALAQSFSSEDEGLSPSKLKKHREIKEFNQKIRQSGFHVVVRVAVSAPTYDRRNDIIEGISGAFKTTGHYNQWTLSPVIRKQAVMMALKNRQMPILSSQSLLCDDEVKVLLRFPTKETEALKLERMTPDEKHVDTRLTEKIIPVGTSIAFGESGKTVGFSIGNDDTACKGRMVIAPPGSGKSTLIQIFKNGALEQGHGGSIFDVADGRLYSGSIETTDPKHKDKLVLVDFANTKYPHIFNFNSLGRDADTVGAMFSEFFEVFYKTGSNYRMNSFLRKSAMSTFSNPDATFLELIKLMRDEDYRKKVLPTLRKHNPELFLWWKTEFPKIVKTDSQASEILQPILYRLDELQMNPRLGPIFCGKGGRLRIFDWMNEGKWVLYNLSNGVFLEYEQRILMSFLNYAYWIATLSREPMLQQNVKVIPHHKMYDEPQTYMNATPVTELSISKSRKYRVSDNFFIQTPTQVKDKSPALWTQIIDMKPHILIGGGLDDDNMKLMSKEFKVPISELEQLEKLEYHWYFKTYVGKEAIPPFIFRALDEPKVHGRDSLLAEKWRQHFAPLTLDEVKKEKEARNLGLTTEEYSKLLESMDVPDDEEGVPLG